MNVVFTVINSLDEIDFDDVYERSKDVLELNWPKTSPIQGNDIKTRIVEMINSGVNNDWPGLNLHRPSDRYFMFKTVDTDTGLLLGVTCGYITEDGTFDGRHSFSTPDSTGSRNFLYTAATQVTRNQFYRDNGISKIKYNNIPSDSSLYRLIKFRENAGNYVIISDEEVAAGVRTVVTQPNL